MNQRHWCGLTAKLGTFLAGIFTILVTDMFLIFEKRHMKGSTNCSHIQEESPTVNHWMICRSFSFSIFLAIITVFICCFLLYSVFAQFYIGMVTYVVWIIFYEASNLLLQILTNRPGDNTLIEVRVMRWFGLVSRVLMHSFWLFFVVTYAQVVFKSQSQGSVTARSRRISVSNQEIARKRGTQSSRSPTLAS